MAYQAPSIRPTPLPTPEPFVDPNEDVVDWSEDYDELPPNDTSYIAYQEYRYGITDHTQAPMGYDRWTAEWNGNEETGAMRIDDDGSEPGWPVGRDGDVDGDKESLSSTSSKRISDSVQNGLKRVPAESWSEMMRSRDDGDEDEAMDEDEQSDSDSSSGSDGVDEDANLHNSDLLDIDSDSDSDSDSDDDSETHRKIDLPDSTINILMPNEHNRDTTPNTGLGATLTFTRSSSPNSSTKIREMEWSWASFDEPASALLQNDELLYLKDTLWQIREAIPKMRDAASQADRDELEVTVQQLAAGLEQHRKARDALLAEQYARRARRGAFSGAEALGGSNGGEADRVFDYQLEVAKKRAEEAVQLESLLGLLTLSDESQAKAGLDSLMEGLRL
ncbi:uncharacterized protein AB675_992 [Cyphellophora attinorum]|uniref:Uncharacterized protein n=1 Tax=Cyphellophora attinorum TaxID=1664694 RepID=A0A0N1H8G7_9EURO|nr:uncharacterized protein AB675_992 [Phialophora attinorum]KPI38217.1 hypothetical protein AB675_992 [Phialophora attinorum]